MQCLSPSISLKPRRSKGRNYCVADPLLPWSIAARLCEPEVCCLSCLYTSSVVCLLYRGLLSALPLHLFCCLPSLQRFAVCLDFTPFLLSAFLPEVCCLPCLYTSCVVCLLYRGLLSALLLQFFCLPSCQRFVVCLPLHLLCCLPSLQRFVVCLAFTILLSAFLPEVCCLPCLYTSCVVCLLYRSVLSAML